MMAGQGEQKERQTGEREARLRWLSERETDKRLTTRYGNTPAVGQRQENQEFKAILSYLAKKHNFTQVWSST